MEGGLGGHQHPGDAMFGFLELEGRRRYVWVRVQELLKWIIMRGNIVNSWRFEAMNQCCRKGLGLIQIQECTVFEVGGEVVVS